MEKVVISIHVGFQAASCSKPQDDSFQKKWQQQISINHVKMNFHLCLIAGYSASTGWRKSQFSAWAANVKCFLVSLTLTGNDILQPLMYKIRARELRRSSFSCLWYPRVSIFPFYHLHQIDKHSLSEGKVKLSANDESKLESCTLGSFSPRINDVVLQISA